jgi:hypothetical protein
MRQATRCTTLCLAPSNPVVAANGCSTFSSAPLQPVHLRKQNRSQPGFRYLSKGKLSAFVDVENDVSRDRASIPDSAPRSSEEPVIVSADQKLKRGLRQRPIGGSSSGGHATNSLSLSSGQRNSKVFRGRWFRCRAVTQAEIQPTVYARVPPAAWLPRGAGRPPRARAPECRACTSYRPGRYRTSPHPR